MQMKIRKEGEEELAGPAHTFTVKEVKAHSYPDLDDEFASKEGDSRPCPSSGKRSFRT